MLVSLTARGEPWDLTVTLENDSFRGTDQHYTNGIRLAFDQPFPVPTPGAWRWKKLPALGLAPRTDRFGLALSQQMYTPQKLSASQLLLNDRPYAGWLYASGVYERVGEAPSGELVSDRLELMVGVVGPWSQADNVQWWWHRDVVHTTLPRGWDLIVFWVGIWGSENCGEWRNGG